MLIPVNVNVKEEETRTANPLAFISLFQGDDSQQGKMDGDTVSFN